MKLGRREALHRQERRNWKAAQFKKNTVMINADGEVFAQDDNLREAVERQLYYNPVQDRWMARSVRGATIVHR